MSAETIFALASAAGRAGIAVVRVSGDGTRDALARLGCPLPPPRKAVRAKFTDPASGEILDDGLLLWFPAPHSFTGEDVAELHIHGGRAVTDSMLAALGAAGLRPAEAGEFTRRAFFHDKMDLTQAEALADLVDAETRVQQKQALRQMGGALKEIYDDWRHRLLQALAHLEAVIDFPDEDLPPDVANKVWAEVDDLQQAIVVHLGDARGEHIREGLMVAIIGPPNAGKSSLLNALARREAAIVSPIPGTTRDVIEVHLNLGGYAVTLADTAGLREGGDAIESEGIARAKRRAADADLKIALFDGAVYPARETATMGMIDDDTLVAINKADLLSPPRDREGGIHVISAKTGFGMDAFVAALLQHIRSKADTGAAMPLTRIRHRKALEECSNALIRARAAALAELASEDLRLAARALGRLTGRIDVEDVLDVVFRDFCIGK